MLYALKYFNTQNGLWYLDWVNRSKSLLKRREKKFKKNKDFLRLFQNGMAFSV